MQTMDWGRHAFCWGRHAFCNLAQWLKYFIRSSLRRSVSTLLVSCMSRLLHRVSPCCKVCGYVHQHPLLLIPSQEKFTWNLHNVLDNTFLQQVKLPNKRFCGSSGWLVTTERDFRVTLINPFRRVKGSSKASSIIRLPRLYVHPLIRKQFAENRDYFVMKATITSDPILDAKNCTVVVIYGEKAKLAFFRLGKDTAWTYVKSRDQKWTGFEEVVQADQDKFYAIKLRGDVLFCFDTNPSTTNSSTLELSQQTIPLSRIEFNFKSYLVYSIDRELLMVHRYEDRTNEQLSHTTLKFRVYKLSFDKCEWIQKETLGDVALFVGDNSTISLLASNFPGCKPNCVYFNQDDDDSSFGSEPITDYGVYDMEKQTISKPYCADAIDLVESSNLPSIWV